LPIDGSGTYYFPLALVRIFTGFGSTSTIATSDVRATTYDVSEFRNVASGARIHAANGNNDANSAFAPGGAFAWPMAAASKGRPGPWLSPEWDGGKSIYAQIDNLNASSAEWSHQGAGPGSAVSLVDNSIDWRKRIVRVTSVTGTETFATAPGSTGVALPTATGTDLVATSVGNTLSPDGLVTTGMCTVWSTIVNSTVVVALLVSPSLPGLYWCVVGATSPETRFAFWIDATGQMPNP
jgi:hypothetical protein